MTPRSPRRLPPPLLMFLAVVLLACGALRFLQAGLLPAMRGLTGDFGATFPAPYFARLRPDFDTSQVWHGGWYDGPMVHLLTLPLFLVPRWSMVPVVWAIVNLGAVAVSLVMACRLSAVALDGSRAALVALAGLWLLFQPLINCFAQGNIELCEMAITLVAMRRLTQGRDASSGVLIGMAAMIKFLPVGFLGWFLIRRRWRALLAATASILVIAVLTAATLGWRSNVTVQDMLWAQSSPISGFQESSITSLFLHRTSVLDAGRELLHWIPSERNAVAARAGLLASALLVAGFGIALLVRRRRAVSAFEISVLFMGMFMIPPWNHDYYYIFALLPFSVLFLRSIAGRHYVVLACAVLGYLLISPLSFGALDRLGVLPLPAAQALTYLDIPVYGALLLWFLVTQQMYAEPDAQPQMAWSQA